MKGSVIRRMYAGFLLIIIMFALTIYIMTQGMKQIHTDFENVTGQSLPLVQMANKTSVQLLSADKAFKNFLTTQDEERMQAAREAFSDSQQDFNTVLKELANAATTAPSLTEKIEQLNALQTRYFSEAQTAMDNYQSMFSAQEQVQSSYRGFQRLQSELRAGMQKYVADQKNMTLNLMSKRYFNMLDNAEATTSDALASNDAQFVAKAMETNSKAVEHLNYAYRGLTTRLPAIKKVFQESVDKFTKDIGEKGGVLDQHNNYLAAKAALYQNIANLAQEVDSAMAVLDSFNHTANTMLDSALEDAGAVYDQDLIKAVIIGVIASLIAAGIGYHIAHSVREPITRILANLEKLTQGDMTTRIEIRYNNEFSRVARHINSLANNLHEILEKLNVASDDLTTTAQTNQSTSLSAQQKLNTQREQTANVATAMTEMAHSVQEVANSAQSSLEQVQQVEKASYSGHQIMSSNIETIHQLEARLRDSVSAVNDLQKMSGQIGTILDVIRNIAEQTNLLALNAAIEAARAGEQGRGFAVVADEVRVLAQRTTESTQEIETMINNLQGSSTSAAKTIESCMSDMETSVEKTNQANAAMQEIQATINEISSMSSHISQAASEQSETTADIARRIEEINLIADESYQAMSDIADTSSNLSSLATQQSKIVHQFKL